MNSPTTANDEALLTIVIPVYNEASALPTLMTELKSVIAVQGVNVVFVDDASTDGTPRLLESIAGEKRVRVLRHKVNRGYGGALKTGLLHARTRYAVTMDADGQHRFEDVVAMLARMQASDADLIIGQRAAAAAHSAYREVGKTVIRVLARIMLGARVGDLNSGMKMYRTDLVQAYLPLCPDSMAFSDIVTLIFIGQKHLVLEQPIEIRHRMGGHSTITTRTAFETVMEIYSIIMLFNPLRIFLPVALFFIIFGVAWGLPLVLRGRGVSVGSMLSIMTGLIGLFLGLLAEQLALIRRGHLAMHPRRFLADEALAGTDK